MEDRNFWNPRLFLLKGPHTGLLGLTPSELQHWGSRLKGTRNIQGRTELSGVKTKWPNKNLWASGLMKPDLTLAEKLAIASS